ncbi:hypothetical protein AAVH_33814 [Aphelenchoides avenae]|nr:hypothetical protein AAVH_33814 [Aphelenchus avenae]
MTKYHVYLILHMKTVFGSAGLIGSIVFWVLLKQSPAAASVNDRVIKMTVAVELVCCIIPGLAALIWSIIVPNVSLSQILGEHATFALSIDGAITSTVFYRLLLRGQKKTSNVVSAWPTPQSQQQT